MDVVDVIFNVCISNLLFPLCRVCLFQRYRLLSEGFKKEEINDAALAAHEAKASIHHSAQRKSWDQINEKLENTTRLLTTLSRRPMLRRSSSSSR